MRACRCMSASHSMRAHGRSSRTVIFDSVEVKPLPLTHANLARCIVAPYEDAVVRGYQFTRFLKTVGKKRSHSPSD